MKKGVGGCEGGCVGVKKSVNNVRGGCEEGMEVSGRARRV